MNSVTRYGPSSTSPTSCTTRMCGWFKLEAARASCESVAADRGPPRDAATGASPPPADRAWRPRPGRPRPCRRRRCADQVIGVQTRPLSSSGRAARACTTAGVSRNVATRSAARQHRSTRARSVDVGSARLGEIRLAFGVFAGHRGVETASRAAIRPACSSGADLLCSHTFAVTHSRFTVAGEMWSASAVSSTDKPPKNRSSTTRLC